MTQGIETRLTICFDPGNEKWTLRVFENRILRRISGPKRDANGERRRLHNEELYSLYHLPNIARVMKSRRLRWAGHVHIMEDCRCAFKILTGKPTGKRPLGRPRRRWEDNIWMDLKEIGINAGVQWVAKLLGTHITRNKYYDQLKSCIIL